MRLLIFLFVTLYSMMSLAADPVATPAASKTDQATTPAAVPAPATPKNESVGLVIWTKGQVNATSPNQEKRLLTRKSDIYKEDIIESNKSSTAQISLTDGTMLAIAENTKIQLVKYNYDRTDHTKNHYLMDIAKGGLRTITGEISKNNPKETKTKTPIATLTTLGTHWLGNVRTDGESSFAVIAGKVLLTTLKGKTITLSRFDQRFATIDAVNQNIVVLKSMPQELRTLNATIKIDESKIMRPNIRGGGFCVGR